MICTRSRWLLGMAMLAGSQLLSTPAARALPPEFLANIALSPTDPMTFAVRWESGNGGILFTHDGGKTFQMHPTAGFYAYPIKDYVPMLFGGDGKLLVALIDALMIDDGMGCNIMPDPMIGMSWVAALAADPTDPKISYVVTTGDTKGVHAGLWKRDATGTLTAFGASEPLEPQKDGVRVSGLEVVKDDSAMGGVRFYEAATRYTYAGTTPTPTPIFRVSVDQGATWQEHNIPDPGDTAGVPRIWVVDSTDPNKLLVSLEVTSGDVDPNDPMLYSVDGGKTFMPFNAEIQSPSQAIQLPSGQILIGDQGQDGGGLWTAMGFDQAPSKIQNYSVTCLAQEKSGTIHMCKQYEIGLYDAASNAFCSTFKMNEVTDFVSCPGQDLAAKSESQLCNAWCGAAHYSLTPACRHYDNSTKSTLCGVKACMFDIQDPDPSKHWIEPPGTDVAPRCAGFDAPPEPVCGGGTAGGTGGVAGGTGGVTGGTTGGVTGGTTGGVTGGTTGGVTGGTGGVTGGTTGGVTGGTAVGTTAGGATAGSMTPSDDMNEGCACDATGSRGNGLGMLSGLFALGLLGFVRRRRAEGRSA